jgi:hypothetical protein
LAGKSKLGNKVMNIKTISLLVFFSVHCFFSSSLKAADDKAFQVKAAYLFQFFRYTDWQDIAQANTIGIVSAQNLNANFIAIEGKLFNEQELTIRTITNMEDALNCCNMIYFAPNTEEQLQQWGNKLPNGVVTVADESLVNGDLSMIQLYKKGTKLKFIVNAFNTKAKKVDLSSRLLRVAIKVNN